MIVIPGFFGVTQDGDICTFFVVDHDIALDAIICSRCCKADALKHTDVNEYLCSLSGIIKHPFYSELTYKEMRELAILCWFFGLLHDDACSSIHRGKIPLVIKSNISGSHLEPIV